MLSQPFQVRHHSLLLAPLNQVQMKNQETMWAYNSENYNLHQKVTLAIAAKLVEAAEKFLGALRHPNTHLNHITAAQGFAHLYATYAHVDDKVLAENEENLSTPWDPDSEQIESLFDRLLNCQQIAAETDPITDRRLIRAGKEVIEKTGKFAPEMQTWNGRMPAHPTWPQFREYWTTAYIAYLGSAEHRQAITTQAAGYNANEVTNTAGNIPDTANSVSPAPHPYDLRCGYCWSHGVGFDPAHTSATCTNSFTKHHPASHHRAMRPIYLHEGPKALNLLTIHC